MTVAPDASEQPRQFRRLGHGLTCQPAKRLGEHPGLQVTVGMGEQHQARRGGVQRQATGDPGDVLTRSSTLACTRSINGRATWRSLSARELRVVSSQSRSPIRTCRP